MRGLMIGAVCFCWSALNYVYADEEIISSSSSLKSTPTSVISSSTPPPVISVNQEWRDAPSDYYKNKMKGVTDQNEVAEIYKEISAREDLTRPQKIELLKQVGEQQRNNLNKEFLLDSFKIWANGAAGMAVQVGSAYIPNPWLSGAVDGLGEAIAEGRWTDVEYVGEKMAAGAALGGASGKVAKFLGKMGEKFVRSTVFKKYLNDLSKAWDLAKKSDELSGLYLKLESELKPAKTRIMQQLNEISRQNGLNAKGIDIFNLTADQLDDLEKLNPGVGELLEQLRKVGDEIFETEFKVSNLNQFFDMAYNYEKYIKEKLESDLRAVKQYNEQDAIKYIREKILTNIKIPFVDESISNIFLNVVDVFVDSFKDFFRDWAHNNEINNDWAITSEDLPDGDGSVQSDKGNQCPINDKDKSQDASNQESTSDDDNPQHSEENNGENQCPVNGKEPKTTEDGKGENQCPAKENNEQSVDENGTGEIDWNKILQEYFPEYDPDNPNPSPESPTPNPPNPNADPSNPNTPSNPSDPSTPSTDNSRGDQGQGPDTHGTKVDPLSPTYDPWGEVFDSIPEEVGDVCEKVLSAAEGYAGKQLDKLIAKYPGLQNVLNRLGIDGTGIVRGVVNIIGVLVTSPDLGTALGRLTDMALNSLKQIAVRLIQWGVQWLAQKLFGNMLIPQVVKWVENAVSGWAVGMATPVIDTGLQALRTQIEKCAKRAGLKINPSAPTQTTTKFVEELISNGKKNQQSGTSVFGK